MVIQATIERSNAHLPSDPLTAVFVGGTSGIGLYTLLAFAKHCTQPTIHIVGRSQSAADKILSDLHGIEPNGTYSFHQADVAYIKNVDAVCEKIRATEKSINLLILSQGTFIMGTETDEGLHAAASLVLHSRHRFTLNLLPLLQGTTGIRRVVSIFAGTKEGDFLSDNDLQMRSLKNPMKGRAQATSAVTLLMEEAQRRAPTVSFVHSYPGFVKSNIARGGGVANLVMRIMSSVVGPLMYIPEAQSGERHLFLGTSGKFPSKEGGGNRSGVEIEEGVEVAVGTDGKKGSGVYSVGEVCESGGEGVLGALRKVRAEGKGEWVREEVTKDFVRITGKECL